MANEDDHDEKEKREARELLSGFDRPGRGPKQPQSGDFVAHYSGRNEQRPAKPPPRPDRSRAAPTFVLPKKKPLAALLPWLGAAALMLVLGFLVAVIATRDGDAKRAGQIPSAATTITSVIRAREDVPPPDPAPTAQTTETTISIPASGSAPSSSKAHARSDDSYLRDF